MAFSGKFYAPISAGGMNHVGAQPQNNVTFPIAHPVGPQSSGIIGSSRGSELPKAVSARVRSNMGSSVRGSFFPPAYAPIQYAGTGYGPSNSTTGGPVSLGFVNWFHHPNT